MILEGQKLIPPSMEGDEGDAAKRAGRDDALAEE